PPARHQSGVPVVHAHFTHRCLLSKVASESEVTLDGEIVARQTRANADNTLEPLAKLLGILSSPWTLLLLHRLHVEGPKRFGELKRRLGAISTKTPHERSG